VIEAMSFGKPVFLSTLTSLPEIGGDTAYYFRSFDAAHMQQTLEEGLAHYTQSQPQAAIQQWAAGFSWQKAAKEYWDVYRSLLQ
jgi:glycosyltransferase involved in cell wall biosynthesis